MRKIASTKWICKWLIQIAISLGWNLLQRKQNWFVHLDLLEMPCIFYQGKLPCTYVIFTTIWILGVFFSYGQSPFKRIQRIQPVGIPVHKRHESSRHVTSPLQVSFEGGLDVWIYAVTWHFAMSSVEGNLFP